MKRTLLPFLTSLALLAGCATTRTSADPRIVLDSSAASIVDVLTVDYGETTGANPVVSLAVRSKSGSQRMIEYRAVWIGPNGAAIDSVLSIWKTVTLDPYEVADLKAVAPRSDVKGFRIEIRRAK